MALKVGDLAPDFTLASTSGDLFTLSELNQPVVLYFYPKDFTPACTNEACSFRENFEQFNDVDVLIVGISKDSLASHKEFKKKYELPFDLLSDKGGKVCKAYKALMPVVNIPKRITYLIDKKRKIKAVYSDLFGYKGHITRMIEEISK